MTNISLGRRSYFLGCRWEDVMAVGIGVLNLAPEALWAMTPREFSAAIEGVGGGASSVPERDDLTNLMKQFPDS